MMSFEFFRVANLLDSIDPMDDSYGSPASSTSTTTTKSIFKPMPFVRAGESLAPPAPVLSQTNIKAPKGDIEDSDDEEDVIFSFFFLLPSRLVANLIFIVQLGVCKNEGS